MLLTPIETAVRLRLSIATVYTLLRTGELASRTVLRPGRSRAVLMVPETAVLARERQAVSK